MIARTRTHLGERFSEGARQLWLRMLAEGWSQGELARQVGVKVGVVGRWLFGDRKPEGESRTRVEERLEIGSILWDKPATEPFEVPAPVDEEPSEGAA